MEQAILKPVLQLIGRQKSMLDIQQLYLPMRKGGLGLLCLTAHNGLACKAGFIAAAAILSEGCKSLQQSLKGPAGDVLQEFWTQIHSTCTCKGNCAYHNIEQVTLKQGYTDAAAWTSACNIILTDRSVASSFPEKVPRSAIQQWHKN